MQHQLPTPAIARASHLPVAATAASTDGVPPCPESPTRLTSLRWHLRVPRTRRPRGRRRCNAETTGDIFQTKSKTLFILRPTKYCTKPRPPNSLEADSGSCLNIIPSQLLYYTLPTRVQIKHVSAQFIFVPAILPFEHTSYHRRPRAPLHQKC
jgi:hypothetical protein